MRDLQSHSKDKEQCSARPGFFITFEGGEGAGKTTLIEKIHAALSQEKKVVQTRAPGGTKTGLSIRDILLHHDVLLDKRCELLLFLADRGQHVAEVILPALEEGKIVLCDRFNDSTVAYQGGARGFNAAFVRKLCAFSCHDVQPDLTLYLDLDPKIGFQRVQQAKGGRDRIESEDIRFHQTIRKAFHKIAKKEPHRFLIVDASQTPEEVFNQAIAKIYAFCKPCRK